MKLLKNTNSKSDQQGFTILELMIATTVLAVILLMVTVMITGIGNLFYKGVTLSQTQDTTRAVADQLSQDIELTRGAPTVPVGVVYVVGGVNQTFYATCIGTVRYSYVNNLEVGVDIKHALWRDVLPSTGCTPVDLTTDLVASDPGGTEMLGNSMRLTSLTITIPGGGSKLYPIQLSVAYGASDLLTLTGYTTTCNGNVGDRFCSTDQITTAALQRL